jgi:hypothetical protein
MEVGNLYHVTFQKQMENYQWQLAEMTATYIGKGVVGEELFSLRPVLGTTAIRSRAIWSAEPVPGPSNAREDPWDQKYPSRRVRKLLKEDVR